MLIEKLRELKLKLRWKRNLLIYSSEINKWKENKNYEIYGHFLKQEMIKRQADIINAQILVETGTFYGEMLFSQYNTFNKLISIELIENLAIKAKKRFRNHSKISIYQGDSSNILKTIIKDLDLNTVFWLDGHYSGGETALGKLECPIYEELNHISKLKNIDYTILIDDARLFVGLNDYPTVLS